MPTTDKPILAIGDVHGHLDRLEALLKQEGIIGDCPECEGRGDDGGSRDWSICPVCDGDAIARIRDDCVVVQLGDLGHFGSSYEFGKMVPGSSMGDLLTYSHGARWLDFVLWGNHDRAVIDQQTHGFVGYIEPAPETFRIMQKLRDEKRLILAYAGYGFLLTHAGLHKQFKYNDTSPECKTDAAACAMYINAECDLTRNGIVDAVSRSRSGASNFGGILWRDASESLFDGFPQIFGHTSKPKLRRYQNKAGESYCIDVGDKDNGRLMGMWLPEERVVEVDLTKG